MFDTRPLLPLMDTFYGKVFSLPERCLYGLITAFAVGAILGGTVIRSLKKRRICQVFRTKQQVRELASLHSLKEGVPTMGGILILLAAMGAVLLWTSFNSLVIVTVTVYILCTLVGALDDIVKIVMGRSKGLNCWQKLIFQGLITWGVVKLALSDPPLNNLLLHFDWQYFNQFEPKDVLWGISIFYFLVLAGTSNAVNITDGVDGLAIANVMLCLLFLGIAAFFSRSVAVASHSLLTYSAGAGELAVLCFCFIGAGLAFALFNCHPASVFMGDMGSIGLGGLLAIVALLLRIPFALLLAGFIFVVEAISVMLQVTSKKVFRRRIFLMAPLHHHFELRGYSEKKIVGAAVLVQLAATAAAFIVVFYGYWSH